MNKKDIKVKIIKFLRFIPDSIMIKIQYRIKMKRKLDLKNVKTFNEKLQWLKLYDRQKIMTDLVDKYEVRQYIAEEIGKEYLIPILGVYNCFEEIEFDKLPNQFVIKCTHDSGGLVICRDKNKFDIEQARSKINKSLKNNFYYITREWAYKNVKPRIIIEAYMENEKNEGLIDYKFYCFNGEPRYLYVSKGLENHATANISFLNMNYEKAEFRRLDFEEFQKIPEKPKNFEQMKLIAKRLSQKFRFVRVDLYEINDKIYFSELTFCPCSGMMKIVPEEWDLKLGEMLEIGE